MFLDERSKLIHRGVDINLFTVLILMSSSNFLPLSVIVFVRERFGIYADGFLLQLDSIADRTITEADLDNDGKISFDEFCRVSCFVFNLASSKSMSKCIEHYTGAHLDCPYHRSTSGTHPNDLQHIFMQIKSAKRTLFLCQLEVKEFIFVE